MPDKNTLTLLLGMGAIIVTLGIGTCSTNARINDGFTGVNLRIDDTNRRMNDGFNNVNQRIDDTNQRIDDVQDDVREIRSMLFDTLKTRPPAD